MEKQPDCNSFIDVKSKRNYISMREILYHLFSRFSIFLLCLFLVPLLAVSLVYLLPQKYEATAKILLRHNDTSSFSFSKESPRRETNISSQSVVEILTSLPVCKRVVEQEKITREEIPQPAYKILLRYFAGVTKIFTGRKQEEKAVEVPSSAQLAKELRKSIFPKITDKGQAGLLYDDELIEVRVRFLNRNTVAGITNALCREFINEYYRIYEEDASRIYRYLDRQVSIAEANIENTKKMETWSDRDVTMNPIVARISDQIAEMERKLFRLRSTYPDDAIEVKQMKASLADARIRLQSYKARESTESVLTTLKEKRLQAYLIQQAYKNRLIPISIVEKAITPPYSPMANIIRYSLAAGIGLLAGLCLGFALVMFLSVIDSRLFTPWDIEKIFDINIIGSVREDRHLLDQKEMFADLSRVGFANAILEILGIIDLKNQGNENILMVTGVSGGEGKTTIALQVACALANDRRTRVLLVDADFVHQTLSGGLSPQPEATPGLMDVLTGETDFQHEQQVCKTAFPNLDFLPAGKVSQRQAVGFYKKSLKLTMDVLRKKYDLIIIDTPGMLNSVDTILFAAEADHILMVLKSGTTRKEPLLKALQMLHREQGKLIGALLNFRTYPVPGIFYGRG